MKIFTCVLVIAALASEFGLSQGIIFGLIPCFIVCIIGWKPRQSRQESQILSGPTKALIIITCILVIILTFWIIVMVNESGG